MRQIIVDLFSFDLFGRSIHLCVYGYGLMLVCGFLAGIYLARWRARRCGEDAEAITKIGLLSLVGGIVGGRVAYIIQHWSTQFAEAENPLSAALDITSGGLIYHGGLILATVLVLIYLKLRRLPIRRYLDIVAVSLMVGLAFGRAGCLLNGCCYGGQCEEHWALGMRFPMYSQPLVKFTSGAGPFSPSTDEPSYVYEHQFANGLVQPDERLFDALSPGHLWPPRYLHGKLNNDQLATILADESQWEAQFKALAGAGGRLSEEKWRQGLARGDGLLRGSENWAEAITHFDRNFDDMLSWPEMRDYLRARKAWITTRFDADGNGVLSDAERQAANNYLQADLFALADKSRSAAVKPAQLIAMAGALLLAGLLAVFFRMRRREGQVFALMAIGYSLIRFVEEGIRDTNAHSLAKGILTHNQYTALAIAAAGVIMLLFLRRLPASAGPTLAHRLAVNKAACAGGVMKS